MQLPLTEPSNLVKTSAVSFLVSKGWPWLLNTHTCILPTLRDILSFFFISRFIITGLVSVVSNYCESSMCVLRVAKERRIIRAYSAAQSYSASEVSRSGTVGTPTIQIIIVMWLLPGLSKKKSRTKPPSLAYACESLSQKYRLRYKI